MARGYISDSACIGKRGHLSVGLAQIAGRSEPRCLVAYLFEERAHSSNAMMLLPGGW